MSTSTPTDSPTSQRDVVGMLKEALSRTQAKDALNAVARASACPSPTKAPPTPSSSPTRFHLHDALNDYEVLLSGLNGTNLAKAKKQNLQDGFTKLRTLIEEVCQYGAPSPSPSSTPSTVSPADTTLTAISKQLNDIQAAVAKLSSPARTPYNQAAAAAVGSNAHKGPQMEPAAPAPRATHHAPHEVTITANTAETKNAWKSISESALKTRIDTALASAPSISKADSAIHGIRKKRTGELVLAARSEQQAQTLLTNAQEWLTTFDNDAKLRTARFQVTVNGVPTTFDPASPTATDTIVRDNNLGRPDIIESVRWIGLKNNISVAKTESSLLLTLTNQKVADHIIYSGLSVCGKICDARKFIPAPPQCYRCQAFGHQAKACPNIKTPTSLKCARCAGTHSTRDCKCPHSTQCTNLRTCSHIKAKCANCEGDHKALSAKCPVKQQALMEAAARYGPPSPFFDPQYLPRPSARPVQ